MVLAIGDYGVLGRDGRIPWKCPEDMRHFKRLTVGHAVVMGRRTFESIGRPLPNRLNIVLSSSKEYSPEGCTVAHDLATALRVAWAADVEPRIIGGAALYKEAFPLANKVYLSRIDYRGPGDTYLPKGILEELDSGRWDQWSMASYTKFNHEPPPAQFFLYEKAWQ
jgi:dihydrofolate reductase